MNKKRPTSRSDQQSDAADKRTKRDLVQRRFDAFMAFNERQCAKGRRELSFVEWRGRLTTPKEFK